MIALYKTYIEEILKKIGLSGRIYTSLKELKQYSGAELGGILASEEKFNRNGTRAYVSKDDKECIRKKVWDRDTNILVVLAGKTETETDEIMVEFLKSIDSGIDDKNGNWVSIECQKGDWVEDMDSVLRNKMAIQLLITFKGGVYKDSEITKISNIKVESKFQQQL